MRCPNCRTNIPKKSSFCSNCGSPVKKKRSRLPLSITSFFVVFLIIHISASKMWPVDENNVLQAPPWYSIVLLGVSLSAAIAVYILLGQRHQHKNNTDVQFSLKRTFTGSNASPNKTSKARVIATEEPTTNSISDSFDGFTPRISLSMQEPEIPELQGNYAKAIFLWATSSSATVKNNDGYPRYIVYECGIRDARGYHQQLIHDGYLEKDSIETAFMSLRVVDLKPLATSLGVSSSGKKADIVTRIMNVADEAFIRNYCPETYSLTQKGQLFLNEHDEYIQLHRHKTWGIDWQEYDSNHTPDQSFNETVMSILVSRAAKDTHYFGRQEYLSLYQMMAESGNRRKALSCLLQILYIDLSGVCGMSDFENYKNGMISKAAIEEAFSSIIVLAPGIIEPIHRYSSDFTYDIVEKLYTWQLPVQICPKELFCEIVRSIMDNTFNYDEAKQKLGHLYSSYVKQLK